MFSKKYFITLCYLLATIACFCQQMEQPKKKIKKEEGDNSMEVSPVLIRGPYLQNATPVSIMVRWRTDASCRSRVRYGKTVDALNEVADDSALVTEHKVSIKKLEPYTKYYYSIGAIKNKLQGDSNNYFFTLPVAGSTNTVRIAAFGDCGNNSVNQRSVRDQVLSYLHGNYLNAWILLGDNTYPDGTDAEFQQNFFNVYKDNLLKKYPLFTSPGNHDYHDIEFSSDVAQRTHEIAYYQNFSMPIDGESGGVASHTQSYYSFDIGNVHFLSLDSYGKRENARLSDTTGPQARWIKEDLEKARNATWVVAYWHHPPYTMGSHNSDNEDELVDIREKFVPLLERYGVDLVLCGHSHDYERSRMMLGYYGKENDFDSTKYLVANKPGNKKMVTGDTLFVKNKLRSNGTIYVVSGSAGKLGGMQSTFPHNAMYYSDAEHGGASYIEVTGNTLVFKWICADGVIRDQFSIVKNIVK
ncbi:metallophosphoesterase family protein [Chitinophagaceae bacterium 26-R-25]|nr:metallophosphoesterase family protein [Chitinophagaceae bacterium 26-R-25]